VTITDTATVETLTAEVRVLMVGKRQITLSVAKQLDMVKYDDLTVFGRIRMSDDQLLIGADPNGNLATAKIPDACGPCDVLDTVFIQNLPAKVHVSMGLYQQNVYTPPFRCDSSQGPLTVQLYFTTMEWRSDLPDGVKVDWMGQEGAIRAQVEKTIAARQVASARYQAVMAQRAEALAAPLIVLAGLR
jgi:hypothetical protein